MSKSGLKLMTFGMALIVSAPTLAYVGPGAGISLIGSLFGLLAVVFVTLGAILFWPIRRLMRRKKLASDQADDITQEQSAEEARSTH